MMDSAEMKRLQDILRRESRSLLQYVRESAPYAIGPDRKLLAEVQRIAEEESIALDQFADFLTQNRVPLPYMGSFPMGFTDFNYVAIRYLLPKLVSEQRQDLAALEASASALNEATGRTAMSTLIELHRRHLKELEATSAA